MNVFEGVNPEPAGFSGEQEVKVRTFTSDISSMKNSGGGLPQSQTLKAPKFASGVGGISIFVSRKVRSALIFFGIGICFLAAAAYLFYSGFFAKIFSVARNTGSIAADNQTSTVVFVHTSAFKKPIDGKLSLVLDEAAGTSPDIALYDQSFRSALAGADLAARFVEIEFKGADGKGVSLNQIFSATDGFIVDGNFLNDHFSPDVTVFAYRDESDFWPGYILALKPGENSLSLKSEVSKLETSAKIPNLFLVPTENRGAFYDAMVGNQPVRVTDFSSGVRFVYGWMGDYLIFSTSYAGFVEAAARL